MIETDATRSLKHAVAMYGQSLHVVENRSPEKRRDARKITGYAGGEQFCFFWWIGGLLFDLAPQYEAVAEANAISYRILLAGKRSKQMPKAFHLNAVNILHATWKRDFVKTWRGPATETWTDTPDGWFSGAMVIRWQHSGRCRPDQLAKRTKCRQDKEKLECSQHSRLRRYHMKPSITAASIGLFYLAALNTLLARFAGSCTQGDASRLSGILLTAAFLAAALAAMSMSPHRRLISLTILPVLVLFALQSYFSLRLSLALIWHRASACETLEGIPYPMDGNEMLYGIAWPVVSIATWMGLLVVWLHRYPRLRSKR